MKLKKNRKGSENRKEKYTENEEEKLQQEADEAPEQGFRQGEGKALSKIH